MTDEAAVETPDELARRLLNKRVDSPLGSGTVVSVGFFEKLLDGPYVGVELDDQGLNPDPVGIFDPADVKLAQNSDVMG